VIGWCAGAGVWGWLLMVAFWGSFMALAFWAITRLIPVPADSGSRSNEDHRGDDGDLRRERVASGSATHQVSAPRR
jgi:hypothetical protein